MLRVLGQTQEDVLTYDQGAVLPGGSEHSADLAQEQAMARALPTAIRIPRLNLDAPFLSEPLLLTATGEVEVPDSYTHVGWYGYGPTPGELGPAVVLGHVDSKTGPAVFYSLGQLREGDDIYIDRSDGTLARFVVTRLEHPRQDAFPTEEVYGNIDHAGLRLITCSGTYKRDENRYTHNFIVYAKLVDGEALP